MKQLDLRRVLAENQVFLARPSELSSRPKDIVVVRHDPSVTQNRLQEGAHIGQDRISFKMQRAIVVMPLHEGDLERIASEADEDFLIKLGVAIGRLPTW